MTAAPTPTRTSSVPDSEPGWHGPGRRGSGRPGSRPPLVTAAFAALAIFLGLFWLVLLYVQYRQGALVDGAWVYEQEAWAFDLAAYVDAARRLVSEGTLYSQAQIHEPYLPGDPGLYHYAPPLGVAMLPLTDMAIADSSTVWWLLRVGALLLACLLMPVRPILRAAAFAAVAFSLPGLKDSILGNVSLLLVLPMVLAWRWPDRPLGALPMAAAISIRPSLGVFLVWQLLWRSWRGALWTIAGGLTLLVITLPFVGIEGYRDYLAVLGNLTVPAGATENRDLGATVLSLGAGEQAASLARLASIGLAGGAVLWSLRRDREASYMIMLSASLLLVPLLWDHYLATLVVPAAFLAHRLWAPLVFIPLLSWIPAASPFVVIGTMLLPLVAGRREPSP